MNINHENILEIREKDKKLRKALRTTISAANKIITTTSNIEKNPSKYKLLEEINNVQKNTKKIIDKCNKIKEKYEENGNISIAITSNENLQEKLSIYCEKIKSWK